MHISKSQKNLELYQSLIPLRVLFLYKGLNFQQVQIKTDNKTMQNNMFRSIKKI